MSNEMLKASLKKIKSAPKPALLAVAVGLGLLFCVVWASFLRDDGPRAVIGDTSYSLEVATSPEEQARGLGQRDSLGDGHGMVFTYGTDDKRCFWMKDMRFALDIIWVSADRQVTHIERELAPASYPKTFCADAQYVVELNAGEAARSGLETGQTIKLML